MYQNHHQILATRHHVVQMHYVKNGMELVHAHVCQNILGIHTLAVVLNVYQIRIAIEIKHVQVTDVKIHALELAVLMQNVEQLITHLYVLASMDILAILKYDVN
jgi:hypothetical protein